jgi:hypothetical protein
MVETAVVILRKKMQKLDVLVGEYRMVQLVVV